MKEKDVIRCVDIGHKECASYPTCEECPAWEYELKEKLRTTVNSPDNGRIKV